MVRGTLTFPEIEPTVPLITPVDGSKFKPNGRVPFSIFQTKPVPPLA
jgi:hypothetical protein